MKAVEFCYWLQGFFEISGSSAPLTAEQVNIVRNHLDMVFIHDIDPSYPKAQQPALNTAHQKSHLNMTPEEFEEAGRPRC